MKKRYLKLISGLMCFKKCTTHFSLLIGHFLGQPNEALLILKDLQPNRPDKVTYLANHKKTGLWPWTQLSASPGTVLFRWNVVDHVDHAAPRAPRWWTTVRPRKGMTRSRGRRGSGCPRGEEYEGSLVRLRCEAAVAAGTTTENLIHRTLAVARVKKAHWC